MFEKIDTKEKAYMLGFLIGDGHIAKDKQVVELYVKLEDKEVTQFFSKQTGGIYIEKHKFDKKKRIFPKSGCLIYSKKEKENLIRLFGGRLCKERRVPIMSRSLEPYFIAGLFDAEGCITWGKAYTKTKIPRF